MEWEKLILIVCGGGGLIAGLVALLKEVAARYDKLKEARKAANELHSTLALENRRLDLSEDDRNNAEFQKILDFYDKRVADLKSEITDLKSADSFARPRVTAIYQNVRSVRRKVEQLDAMIFRLEKHEALAKQVEDIKGQLDCLEGQLP